VGGSGALCALLVFGAGHVGTWRGIMCLVGSRLSWTDAAWLGPPLRVTGGGFGSGGCGCGGGGSACGGGGSASCVSWAHAAVCACVTPLCMLSSSTFIRRAPSSCACMWCVHVGHGRRRSGRHCRASCEPCCFVFEAYAGECSDTRYPCIGSSFSVCAFEGFVLLKCFLCAPADECV
jgi:hypothetical protein